MKTPFIASIALLSTLSTLEAQEYYPQNFMPEGTIERLIRSNDTLFGVGNFYMGGYRVGSLISYEGAQRTEISPETPYVDTGDLTEAIPDGNGGWYIAGAGISYQGGNYRGVLHVLADKSVDPDFLLTQDQSFGGLIHSLTLSGNVLYVGGNFQNFPGFNQSHLIAYNTQTNQFINEFNAGFNWQNGQFVNVVQVKNNELIVGGSFGSGQSASCLGRFNRQTGALIHDFNVNAEVRQLHIDADTLYVGGDFSTIAGSPQKGMAKIRLDNNTLMPCANFDGFTGLVNDFEIAGPDIYVAGRYSTVNGQNSPLLTKLNRYNWVTDANFSVTFDLNQIKAIAIQSDQLLIGGVFNQVNGTNRKNLAQVNRLTGVLNAWSPNAEGTIEKIFMHNGNPYVLGNMNQFDRVVRNSFFALKMPDRTVVPMNFNASGFSNSFLDIAKHGNTLFFCGSMANATINGTPVSHLFALNIQTGDVQSIGTFGGLANPFVSRLLIDGNRLYVAGYFTQVNGQERTRLAAFNLNDYSLESWSPELNGSSTVRKMQVVDNKLYIAGNIFRDNPFGEFAIAALSTANGSWQGGLLKQPVPGQNFEGSDFIWFNNALYLAGNHIVNTSPFLQAAVVKLDIAFNLDTQFNGATPLNANGGKSLTLINGVLLVMHMVNNSPHRFLYFHSPLNGDTLSRLEINFSGNQPFTSSSGLPYSYVFDNNLLYIGGNWERVNGNAVSALAIIDGRDETFPDLDTHLPQTPSTALNAQFELFPNPAADYINIHGDEPANWQILDLSGRILMQGHHTAGTQMIPLQTLQSGCYLINISTQNGTRATHKIVH